MKLLDILKRRRDIVVITAALLAALLLYLVSVLMPSSAATTVVVTVGGEEVLRRPLSVNAEYAVPQKDGDVNVICVENGVVYMKEANCRDGLCLRQSRLRNQAGTIVCLPHEVVVKLAGGAPQTDDGLDVIIQ